MKKPQPFLFWILIILFAVIMYNMFINQKPTSTVVSYSRFLNMVDVGIVKSVTFENQDIRFVDLNDDKYSTHMPIPDPALVTLLNENGIEIISQRPSRFWMTIIGWLPFLLLIGFWLFFMRSMHSGGNKAFSFGKSRARLFASGKTRITFKDVAGVNEAKEELQEIVEYLKSPSKFQKLGGRIPRGVLLLGRPGTGKTLLAKAVAGEAGVPFFSISGSDFVEMFVGVGASRVRDLFDNAKKNAPCIAFIDEIDAVGRSRGAGLGGGHDEREQTLNQLLVEMDGFEANDSVIIIAATNRPDVLDPALLRPGRFDRQVIVDLPDIMGRNEILKVHSEKLPLSDDVNLMIVARSTPGFSGADLANLCNEAALIAARKEKKNIEMIDFDEARDKVTLGKERRSKTIDDDEKRSISYHEVGHVLCSVFQDKTDSIHKVTIIPRGFTGGATHSLGNDKMTYSKTYLSQLLVTLMGGRCAEEIVFGELTTGAGNDIQRATDLAKRMVCHWGMSEKIGPMTVGGEDKQVFLGKDFVQQESMSPATAQLVDSEIRGIIYTAHDKATKILTEHKKIMDKMAELLLEKETLNLEEIYELILEEIDEKDKDFINKKYHKACEMKIDTSQKAENEQEITEKTEEDEEKEIDSNEPIMEDQ
ncbi:MAG: ATP-dependent zinc metalloprotease FtsH [Candidatus Cloacimonetes bacterium]|nr:ATP-dependent zinc metalloprotease FtsH [Candidatus Cloacimonadota bacterium]